MSTAVKLAPPHERWRGPDDLRWAVRHWAVRVGVPAPRTQLRPMHTKWASLSTSGRLTLDTGLLEVPRPLGEYVIVHELVHVLAPNHGALLKHYLDAYLPDWRERERALQLWANDSATHHQQLD